MENFFEKPSLIKGGLAVDERGQIVFANDFDFKGVKRFYIAENFSCETIRGFHGHLKEAKYALAVSGTALIVVASMDNTEKPSNDSETYRFVLSAKKPEILFIPSGHANGMRSLERNTKVIFFSTASMEEAKEDDFRFPYDYWGKEVWEIKNF